MSLPGWCPDSNHGAWHIAQRIHFSRACSHATYGYSMTHIAVKTNRKNTQAKARLIRHG
jgi:hypothetical protein